MEMWCGEVIESIQQIDQNNIVDVTQQHVRNNKVVERVASFCSEGSDNDDLPPLK